MGKMKSVVGNLGVACAVGLLAVTVSNLSIDSVTGSPAATKPYRTFTGICFSGGNLWHFISCSPDFFPFYLTEHTNLVNRRLHVLGTSIIIAIMAFNPQIALAVITAGCAGFVGCGLFVGMEHGFVEFGLMLLAFLLASRLISGSVKKAILVPVIAYTFAWVGHFFFEHNKPASFIYPTFSLMGDFVMWYRVVTGQEYGLWSGPAAVAAAASVAGGPMA